MFQHTMTVQMATEHRRELLADAEARRLVKGLRRTSRTAAVRPRRTLVARLASAQA